MIYDFFSGDIQNADLKLHFAMGEGGEGREDTEIFEHLCIKMTFLHSKCNCRGRVSYKYWLIKITFFTRQLIGEGHDPLVPRPLSYTSA